VFVLNKEGGHAKHKGGQHKLPKEFIVNEV